MSASLVLVAETKASCEIPTLIPIKLGQTLIFGRSKDLDVYLDSTLVKNMISRSHAKVVSDAATGKVSLFDMNSTNGVYVNDSKIDVCQLSNGDLVTFGGRGKSISVGTVDPQPKSEFIYRFEQEEDEEEEEGAFELLKALTDHLQLLVTWITTAVLVGSYLFADESSDEFSYVGSYVAPVFSLVGVPFNRATFTATFVVSVGLLCALAFWLLKSSKSKGKKKGDGKKQQ